MNKLKHSMLSFTTNTNLDRHLNNPLFKNVQELERSFFEVEKLKRVKLDLPSQIGMAVYSYAKLKMINFWEFLNAHLMQTHYQIMEVHKHICMKYWNTYKVITI